MSQNLLSAAVVIGALRVKQDLPNHSLLANMKKQKKKILRRQTHTHTCTHMLAHNHTVTLPPGKFFLTFCHLLIFLKVNFSKNSFRNRIRVSNSIDPGQAQHFAQPDLI